MRIATVVTHAIRAQSLRGTVTGQELENFLDSASVTQWLQDAEKRCEGPT